MTAPDIVTAADLANARRLGVFAASRGLPVTSCPYDPAGGTPRARALSSAWMRAYLHTRPPKVGTVLYE